MVCTHCTPQITIVPLVFQAALTLEPGDTTIAKQLQMLQKRQRKARGDCSELIDQNDVVGLKKDVDTTYFYDIREGEVGGDAICLKVIDFLKSSKKGLFGGENGMRMTIFQRIPSSLNVSEGALKL